MKLKTRRKINRRIVHSNAEFEKWANHYGYTFLDVDHSIKYPDTVNKISGVIEEITDIIQNGYDGNGDK